jgi:hypothetical protein
MTKMNSQPAMASKANILKIVGVSVGLVLAGSAHALHFEPSEGTTLDLDTTLAFGAAWRTESPKVAPVWSPYTGDPSNGDNWIQPGNPKFQDLVLQWNSDDGDRNFKKGEMISNRYAITSDMDLRVGKYGLFLRGSIFYDPVYFGSTSWNGKGWDNFYGGANVDCGSGGSAVNGYKGSPDGIPDSLGNCNQGNPLGSRYNGVGTYAGPESINNAMASGDISDPSHFSDKVKAVNGERARFLDAYVYGSFDLGGHTLDLRLGRQAISWGESLLLQGGIGFAQNRIDANAATSPGVELKEIFLPTGTLYGQIDLTETLTMEAYWQYEYLPSELFADGSYWEAQDMLESNVMLVNGQYQQHCMFGTGKTFNGNVDINGQGGNNPCDTPIIAGPVGGFNTGFEHYLSNDNNAMYRSPDVYPANPSDQFGLAFRKLLNGGSEAGIYFIQYHDKYPSFWAGNNGAKDSMVFGTNAAILNSLGDNNYTGPTMSSVNVEGFNANDYTIEYKDRIKLIGLTYNTVIDDIQMGFELVYRKNQPLVPSCTQAMLDQGTFNESIPDPTNPGHFITNSAAASNPYLSFLKGQTFQSACKDPSAKWLAAQGDYKWDAFNYAGSWASQNPASSSPGVTDAGNLLGWPTQAEVFSWNYGVTLVVPPSPLWDTGIFVAELGGWYVGDSYSNQDLKVTSIGGFTKSGDGFSGIFLPQYKNVLEGVDLTIPVFVNYTMNGSFSYFNYNEHALWASIGVEAIYLSNTRFSITYSAFGGRNNMWQDRDNIAIAAKYTF